MSAWLARAASALKIGADRADLWPAGALAWLAYLGWLPLILVVAPPDADAIEAFGVSTYLSQGFPLNAVTLAAAVVLGFAALCLLSAAAEVGLQELASPQYRHPSRGRATLSAFAVILLASVPVAFVLLLVAYRVIAVAPAEYLSSDFATPVLLRIAAHVVPQLVIGLVVLVVVQAVAGVALRRALAGGGHSAAASIGFGLRELRHRPLATVGIAVVATVVDALVLALSTVLLRVLWTPIGSGLGDGLLEHPPTALLLLGFVAIWLGLLLAAGAIHVAVSAWWGLHLGEARRFEAARSQMGSETGDPH